MYKIVGESASYLFKARSARLAAFSAVGAFPTPALRAMFISSSISSIIFKKPFGIQDRYRET